MVEMRGLSNSFLAFENGVWTQSPLYYCEAQTVGEALEKYCAHFGSSMRPYVADPPLPPYADGLRMAIVYDDPQTRFRDVVVQVSISRGGKFITRNYGFDFPLLPGDEVTFGSAGC
jgi:hypothetical protein